MLRHELNFPWPPMNTLVVGTNKTDTILGLLKATMPEPFLLIDDGPIIDALPLPKRRREKSFFPEITHFDVTKHSFNPLKGMNHVKALEFLAVINAIFPEGENTLTKRYADFALLQALHNKPKDLTQLFPRADKKDVGLTDAAMKIDRLLLSPILTRVLTNPTNFSFSGVVLARLDRAELGDDDCYALANLLISQYKGQVVIPDFGFYGCAFHTSLIRQNRLIAGVNFLDEQPNLKNELLLIKEKRVGHCTAADAKTLAGYFGWHDGKTGYTEFILSLIGG